MTFPSSRRLDVLTCVVALVLVSWGCSGLGTGLEKPRISLANIQVKEMKAFETVFLVELRVFNTNDVPLEIKGLDCELALNGRPFASGVTATETTLPAYGTDTVPVLLYSSVLHMARGVMGLQREGRLEYQMTGKLRLGKGAWIPSVLPFKSKGELSLEGLISPPE